MENKPKKINLNYNCPYCKTLKEPKRRFGGLYSEKEIFTCVKCGHEFQKYELSAKKHMDIVDNKIKFLKHKFEKKEIKVEEFEEGVNEALRFF